MHLWRILWNLAVFVFRTGERHQRQGGYGCFLSGLSVHPGGYNGYAKANGSQPGSPAPAPAPARKSVDELAREVLAGKWGNGTDRKSRIASAGYDYTVVQAKVNELLHAQSRPQAVYYTVQRGDTLSAIARKYGTSVATIQRLNPSLIRNVNRIQVGWKIRVK